MHNGFVDLSNGVRTPSPNSLSGLAPVHVRTGSVPVPMRVAPTRVQTHQEGFLPTEKPPPTKPTGLQTVTPPPGASALLDPLVDFSPSQLNMDSYRISVAW